METFDYIAVKGLKYIGCDSFRLFPQLLNLLKPEGVISAVVLGFSGYYGLAMLGTIIQKPSWGRDLKEAISIAKVVIAQFPHTHPAFKQETLMESLKSRDEKAFNELLTISKDKIYTVSRLMESIPKWGGMFLGWVFPRIYDPSQQMETDNYGINAYFDKNRH